jgi:hypothetical protein
MTLAGLPGIRVGFAGVDHTVKRSVAMQEKRATSEYRSDIRD